jgi:hypothetical protein
LCALPQSTPSRSLPDPLQRLSPLPHTFRPLSQVRIRQLPRSTVTTWIETLPQSLTILLHPLQRRPPPRRPTATPARARTSAQLPTLSTWRSSRFAEGLGFPSRILVLGSVRCWGLSIDVAQLQGCRGFRVSIADFGIGVCALLGSIDRRDAAPGLWGELFQHYLQRFSSSRVAPLTTLHPIPQTTNL